jgi:hypothetical protein
MKTSLKFLAIFLAVGAVAHAQVEPAATGPGGPGVQPAGPNLQYSLRFSQAAEFGGYIGNWQTSTASGQLDYLNGNERFPFTMDYTGGYTWTISGPDYLGGVFQNLWISQGMGGRKWRFRASDDLGYRPSAPYTGLSGVAGIGEPIGGPSPAPPSTETILTLKTHTLDNSGIVNLDLDLNFATTLTLSGTSNVLYYPNGDGLNTDGELASSQLTRRLNARSSLSGEYLYAYYTYPDYDFSLDTNTGLFGYNRNWTKKLSTTLSVGPEWVSSSDSAVAPSATRIAANAAINYKSRSETASVSYRRATSSGAGYLEGADLNWVAGNLERNFGPKLKIGLTGTYSRTTGLVNNGNVNTRLGGAQITRRVAGHFSLFANYTVSNQSASVALPTNTLNNTLQMMSFGIGYSPRETRLTQ